MKVESYQDHMRDSTKIIVAEQHRQPYPTHRVSRAAWLAGEIRRVHAQALVAMPGADRGDDARLQATWERVQHSVNELRALTAELEGLEAK